MTRLKQAGRIGGTLLKIYTCHLLVFTAGGFCGAFVGLSVSQAVFVGMLKSRGLL